MVGKPRAPQALLTDPRTTPWTKEMFRIIQDEGPQAVENVFMRVMYLVPPQRALRQVEKDRKRSWDYHRGGKGGKGAPLRANGERVREHDLEDLVRMGSRRILTWTLYSMVARGRLVRFKHEGEWWVRLPTQRMPKKKEKVS